VPQFHAGDFAHSRRGFERFYGNEMERRALVSKLLDIIQRCGLRKFGAVIKKNDVAKGKAAMDLASDTTVDPYVFCCRSTLDDVYAFATNQGIGRQVRTIFEKGDSEDLLRKHLKKHALAEPEFAWSKKVVQKGTEQPRFVGLQAAGWVAWEYYVDFCRVAGLSDHEPTDKGRAAFQTFETIPGFLKIPFMSNPLHDVLKQLGRGAHGKRNAVADATRRLTTIRANKQ
jgi:hypothetical protein